ncbi:MFS transporter [Geosporobacter ferrireducens]|uniref:Major facilitator superfamily (MFS) profile domain-containing protein n=1 Tax=Geosporobacter ferrireducens TaxID=1424294 RepID=A0A1D8GM47_9FIRM|nr:MFS transporter [Geosporobacter ferrireducens]AOT71862.1 hypothetical protein Gferi_21385 [Geosporobacter ferrireducens]
MKSKLFTKNFTFLILEQAISMFGTNILKFSISLYILDLTGSAALFGIIIAVSCIPPVFLSPFGGILADRRNKKNLMASLDFGYSIIAVLLGIVLLRQNSLIMISGLMILLSVISSFETPVVQSSIPLVMSENNLVKANAAVNQVSMLSGLLGPLLAGILISSPMTAILIVLSPDLSRVKVLSNPRICNSILLAITDLQNCEKSI